MTTARLGFAETQAAGWIAEWLEKAGFEVSRDAVDYPHSIPTRTYFRMVANQYMSVLSSFSQREIADGLVEMERKYGSRETLEFTDHFDYITGIRPS